MSQKLPELKVDTLTFEVDVVNKVNVVNKDVLFGSIKTGIEGAPKNSVWRKITAGVNSVAGDEPTPAEGWINPKSISNLIMMINESNILKTVFMVC